MHSVRNLLLCAGAVALGAITSCSNIPSDTELRAIGNPEIVYLQRPGNLGVSTSPTLFGRYGVTCIMATGGFWGGFLCSAILSGIDLSAQGDSIDQRILAAHVDQVSSLGFNDQLYAMFVSVVNSTSWLKNKEVDRVPWMDDEVQYTAISKTDSVIYLQPTLTISPDGTEFYVYVVAGIQKFDPNHPRDVYDFRRKEFTFTHKLTFVTPGMNWDEQKAAQRKLRNIDFNQALQAWLDNDGARLHAAFAQDLPQINAGLKELFGD